MHEIDCRTCGNPVLVTKFSPTHTSVQWLEGSSRCPEFRALAKAGVVVADVPGCTALKNSVDEAVRDGRVVESRTDYQPPVPGRLR